MLPREFVISPGGGGRGEGRISSREMEGRFEEEKNNVGFLKSCICFSY